jgi:hypothetical protein
MNLATISPSDQLILKSIMFFMKKGVNLNNILRVAFPPISVCRESTNLSLSTKIMCEKVAGTILVKFTPLVKIANQCCRFNIL